MGLAGVEALLIPANSMELFCGHQMLAKERMTASLLFGGACTFKREAMFIQTGSSMRPR